MKVLGRSAALLALVACLAVGTAPGAQALMPEERAPGTPYVRWSYPPQLPDGALEAAASQPWWHAWRWARRLGPRP
jgi:hypothetical protein